ncbi:MAG: hypothetical protein QME71_01705 [Dehalococcoidia bacterium]|nr:hypothetical protein [Dehalococcoidia bacterium]
MRIGKLAALAAVSFVVAAALAAVLNVSCDDDNEDAEQTRTPTATVAAVTPTAPSPPEDIRDVDLTEQPDVRAMLRRVGGEVVPADVLYADLTDDGREEAVVPIFSGGTAGNLAFLVLSYQEEGLVSILSKVAEAGSVRLSLRDGQLVESQPVYEEGDLPGFPSQIKDIYYKWDGEELVVEREETAPSPNAPPRQ